jgi:hypothetical protein
MLKHLARPTLASRETTDRPDNGIGPYFHDDNIAAEIQCGLIPVLDSVNQLASAAIGITAWATQ